MSLPARKRKKKNAFGATSPPFIDYLKEILRRYPDGGQILKELIQNADDAKASEIVFIYDERRYGMGSVWRDALGKYQGPALYAFNNAAFTDEDWEGIQRAGRSIKQDDPTKVGRFGIGFNSIYHVTDLPCVFSSKHLAVFDPQMKMFDDEEEGFRWSLDDEEDRKHLLEFTDQFKPFQDIVHLVSRCSWKKIIDEQNFSGTLFRFPLRSEVSEISNNLYNSSKVTQLFNSFIADAEISLLFLRNVSSISLMHVDTNGTANVRMKVSVASPEIPLYQECFRREMVEGKTSFKTVSCFSSSGTKTKTEWLVTTSRLTEGNIPEIDSLAEKLSFLSQVDVAFQCDEVKTCDSGRLSCFLPLPNNETNNTGLPVHVNACFGLTDNRRYIKWQEEDQKNDESAMWNELLKKEVLPLVYLKMIRDAVQLSTKSLLPASAVYSLWPDLSKTEHNDRWHEVALDVLKQLFQSKGIFSLAQNEKNWVAASEAVFPSNSTDTGVMSAVSRLLIKEGENLVTVPEHVLKAIRTVFPEPASLKWVTPCLVRNVLRKTEIGNVCKDDKLSLLEYILSDGKYKELHGLQLLPLSDGSFRSFTNKEEDTVLIDNEEFSRVLLPFCKEKFLHSDVNGNTIPYLRQMALTNSNLYNIIILDAKNVAAFARKHLPRDWMENQGQVKWNPSKDGHPPKTWLTEFWKFLNTHWVELKDFIGMPLIPLEPLQKTGSSTLLARLEKNSTLIFQKSRESSLPDQVQKVVKMVGGTVVRKDECLKHHDIESYVLTTSPRNVLQVLLNSARDKVMRGIASASLHEKEEFKMYLSSLDSVSDAEKCLLSALPLFRLMSGNFVAAESKQAVILKSNPAIPADLPVPETIVQCANEADRRLLTLLKVDLLDAAQLAINLVDCIERNAFNKENEKKILTWILNHGNVLLPQSDELLRKSKNLTFIQTEKGERKKPSSVFDPTNKIFQDLFDDDFFPPPVYRTPMILQTLKQLGLRTKEDEISSSNVLHVASQIQKLHIHSRNKAFKKAEALVRVLNRTDLLSKCSEGEKEQLRQMQWVPCENASSVNSKSKKSQKKGLYKPAEIRASKFSAIVGHVMPLNSELSEDVCQKLSLFSPPPAEKVLENLCVLQSIVPSNPNSDFEFKNKLHSTYKFMQENIEYFREEMNKKCITWLWCQSEFVSPRDVVLYYPHELDLSLHIKKVPDVFLPYGDMLKEFGVKETLSDEEIEDIFHDLKHSIDDRDPAYGDPSELKVSISILDWMRKNEKPLKKSTPVPVRAENGKFTLQPLKNTVYCDISDEGLDDLRHDQEEFHVIHEEVLAVTAKWLKTPMLSTRILKPQFIKAEEVCPGIEQCGQTEPITQRIKNILKEYDEESDIFKELIQNAEDAGASTCDFLLDFRTHPEDGLIDDGMALCNGPCLWTFNNERFSEEDWKNIVRVGAASKENKIEKIGNFGLGLNSVYHLTDIPSILSGKSLLILDPNVTHLEKHIQSKANVGIKLDLFQERLFRRFPGQFKSYEGIFDCDLTNCSQNYYNGTLIKLPFRTPKEACKSEISCKVYDKERISALQEHFSNGFQSPLLFLKNINSVSLQSISEGASTPPLPNQTQKLLKISRKVVCSIDISNAEHLQDIRDTLKNLDKKYHKAVDCFGAHITEIENKQLERTNTQSWFLYSTFGTKDSLRMFQREQQGSKFSLPIGGVAVPLQPEAQNVWSPDESCTVGQAYCFLPLPIETGLPVHINGSFAVLSNRKALWQSGIKGEWNKALLQDATASAYITTLLELKMMSQNGKLQNYDYYTFWPNAEKVRKAFQPLVSALYSAITQINMTEQSLELFSNGKTWCSMDKVRFLAANIENDKAVGELAMKVFLNDADSSYCAVPLPPWVRKSFTDCGFDEMVKERTFYWVEFYQIVFKNLDNMDPPCRNALILHALDLNDPAIDELLKSNPCIPTQKSDKLQFINKLLYPHGKVACLYEAQEGRFLDETKNDYFTTKRIQRLSGLGMQSDTLPLEEVVDRAKTILRVWKEDKNKAQKCLQCLFDCMKECSHDVSSTHWETLKHIPFLPAVITDLGNKEVTTLKEPSEVYSQKHYHLVNMTEFSVDHTNLLIRQDHPVLTTLGVNRNPPVETVLKQLKEAHDHSDTLNKAMLLNVADNCYDYLNKYLLDGGDSTAIIDHAGSVPFVFIEGRFVNVQLVAKSGEFEEKPYLYILPPDFSRFENLWNCIGIKSMFTTDQFVAVLEEISTSPGPLSKSALNTSLSIVTKGLYEARDGQFKDCLLPDEEGVLTRSSKLKYNDSPWMPVQAGVKLCHELIPRPIACHLGVETTRHHTLNSHEDEEFSLFAEEFGQGEELTVRIKNIIEAYPSKKDILKELIQNADDAEATEIHFIWDKREHKTEKVFGEKWKMLQGPALCVYNNKTFSDEDLIGIQQLGEGGKHGTFGRTGKYGLGFNSVYQLTDCPSILTGDEYLCISDPNLQYVEGVRKKRGCKYSMDENFKDSFNDVYRTFLPEKFALQTGTMYRLPLRTEAMADKSQISRHVVTDEELTSLKQALVEDPEGLILFLRNITKIQFHVINNNGKMTEDFLIEKVIKSNIEEREGFRNHVRNSLNSGQVVPCQTIYNVQISSVSKQSDWVIAESFGYFFQNYNNEDGHPDHRVPHVALAACTGEEPADLEITGKAFCSLPLPVETGLPVHVNGNFELDSSRRDLWKEDGDSLRTSWNQSLKLKALAPLYVDLLNHLCLTFKKDEPNYLTLIKEHLEHYFMHFPLFLISVDKGWHEMISEVYKSIKEQKFQLIPTLKGVAHSHSSQMYKVYWSSVSESDPTDLPHFTSEKDKDTILQVLEHTGMKLIPWINNSNEVMESFKKAEVEVAEFSPLSVISYLKKKRLNDPTQTTQDLPLPISQTLIKDKESCLEILNFCLSDEKEKSLDLNGLPLFLTHDQVLRKFNSDFPVLISEFANIFSGHESEFADFSVNDEHQTLLQEGKYIEKIIIPVAATFLEPVLQQKLQPSSPTEWNALHRAETETITWLRELWKFFDDQDKQEALHEETDKIFEKIKKHFDWPILPVICPNREDEQFLQSVRHLQNVVPDSDKENPIYLTLFQLGFVTLNNAFFVDIDSFRLKYLEPNLLKFSNTYAVLEQLYDVPHSQFEGLSSADAEELQYYLQNGIRSTENTDEYQSMLKSLPLFETISGKRQRIDLHKNVFVTITKFQEMFPELYIFDDKKGIFLKNSPVNTSLAENLEIPKLSDLEYCVRFILPTVKNLKETQLLDLVKLLFALKHSGVNEKHWDKISSRMRDVSCIRDIYGHLQMASHFYDETVNLYKVMLPEERFVPQAFWNEFQFEPRSDGESFQKKKLKDKVKSFLKEFGLNHKVSEKEITDFALQIESDAKGNTDLDVLKHRSTTLLETVLQKGTEKKSNLMKSIANMKFIFPVQVESKLCDFHRAFAQEREVVAIEGSLLEKDSSHQYLIWTAMPILPSRKCTITHLDTMMSVGAFDQPPSGQVMQNLRNICQPSSKSDISVDTRAAVFSNSYAYLQSVDFDASALADLPLVLTENDTTLVKATQAVLSLPHSNEFRPYLYPIQSNYAIYAEFFKKIGVKEKPTITQLCTVLQEIYQECCDKNTLHPNQQTTVQRAVEQIFQMIKEDKTCNFHKNTLYLPSSDGKLYESNTLFFNDTVFQPKRLEGPLKTKLKLLENLNHCHLGNDPYEHQKLLQLLPQNIRPKFLSPVISENLVGAHAEQCEYGKRCEFSGWFEQHLSSRAFRHGLICLIREQSKGSVSQNEATRMCENIFGKIQINCCSALQTELLLHQEPLEGTRSETQVYVEKQPEASIFYLKHSDDMDFEVVNEIIMHLTKEINGLLNNRLNSFMLPILGHLLLCKNLENVERTLEQQGIHNSMTEEGGFGTRPDPGDPIPEEWIDSLDMNPFNCFEKGEYVGFQKDELKNEYCFAIIVECLDELSGQNRRIPARYKIQIGADEFIEGSSLDLYQFKREQSSPMTFSSCTEMAVIPKPSESTSSPRIPTPQHEPKERPKPQTLDEVKREIDQYLKEIWKMSEEDKCKAIKRLYLRWHPDKNLDNPELANEAFKYLQNKIKELEGGKTAGSTSSGGDHFRDLWSKWNEEARRHRRGRERFYQNNSRRHYNFWSYFTPRDMPKPDIPDREEAKRWYRQAECDLSAAQSEPAASPEWNLFKVHQAVEKALIASEYRRKGRHSGNVSITGLAQQISHYSPHLSEVPSAVAQLRTLGVDAKKTQYPNCHPPPRIPHDQFTHEDAREAVKIAAELLKNVEKYITECNTE